MADKEMPSFHSSIMRLRIGPHKFEKGVYTPKDEAALEDFRARLATVERSMANTVREVSLAAGEAIIANFLKEQGPQASQGATSASGNTPHPGAKPPVSSLQDLMTQQKAQQQGGSTPPVAENGSKAPPV